MSPDVALLGVAMLTMRLVAVLAVPVVLAVLAGNRCLDLLRDRNPRWQNARSQDLLLAPPDPSLPMR